jgi:hypothetical protein
VPTRHSLTTQQGGQAYPQRQDDQSSSMQTTVLLWSDRLHRS